jgi:hypothetical protein
LKKLKEEMIFPLSERDKTEVRKMIAGEEIQEQVVGAVPTVGPTENLKSIDKTPCVGVNL